MTGPLRVALLTRAVYPLHGYGGLERHVYDLVRHLAKRHVRVTLITRPPSVPTDASIDEAFGVDGVRTITVPYLTFPLANRRGTTVVDRSTAYLLFGERAGRVAADLARNASVDLVHGLGASSLGYARQHRRRRLAPFIFNPQGLEEFGATDPSRARLKRLGYWPLRLAVRRCARAADRIIATDRSLVPAVRRHLDVAAERVRTVPNAIDLERCDAYVSIAGTEAGAQTHDASADTETGASTDKGAATAGTGARAPTVSALRGRYSLDADVDIFLSAGRIEENKGFQVLAAALVRYAGRTQRPWRWLVAGEGPFRPRLQAMVDASGLANRVIFLGRIDDPTLHGWYEAASLFVHPTLYEGSSLVTLEAMAHRRAVVATSAGGLPDKVKPGVNGWLVPPGDEEALAKALREATADAGRLRAMGAASRAIVEAEFSWPSVVERLLEVYDELLPGRRLP